jgi:hypothetical protein
MSLLEFHVIISLVGIASGFVVFYGLLTNNPMRGLTALFLATTIITSVTGFPLPPFGFDPPRAVGTLSLILLAVAVLALYAFRLGGAWRWIYVVTAVASLYLNTFVGVIQAFMKVPSLHAFAPTQSETPFAVTQGIVLLIFAAFGFLATRKFHPAKA